jgi:hypothetical protein
MNKDAFDKTVRIPVVTDLVMPGDPELKRQAQANSTPDSIAGDQEAFELRLKQKIDELKSTIGQDEHDNNIARAHAIRTEKQKNDVQEL